MSSLWKQIRKDFPVTRTGVYLDHAAGGPVPLPVLEKIQSQPLDNALHSDFAWMKWVDEREKARASVARFINASPEEVAFTTSTSQGMNFIAEMLADKGAVLTNESEFPSSTVPWLWRKAKVVFQKPESGKIELQTLKKLLTSSVKTIVSSYVQYCTGYRQDLAALGKMKDSRWFVVNATQGFGAFPVDVKKWRADFLVTNSYKWLMGGYGGGVLYIKKNWLSKLSPKTVGWRSMRVPERMDNRRLDLHPHASRYELGCPPFPAILGVAAACNYLAGIGMEKISSRILELTDYAVGLARDRGIEILSPLEPAHRSGILILKVKNPALIWKKLLAQKIYVSPRGGGLRLAPHFYNSTDEIEVLFKALGRLL